MSPRVTVSVVSHRQNALVERFLHDLAEHCAPSVQALLTRNVPESAPAELVVPGLRVRELRNRSSRGFGANHNAAFALCETEYFCVANPDIRLGGDPFPALIRALEESAAGVAGPLVRNPDGAVEDSARRFPTLPRLLRKALYRSPGPDYAVDGGVREVDWVAGMFMLFPRTVYSALAGFDERYFLYYEDIDLCARMQLSGRRVVQVQSAEVTHDARRASRRNLRHAAWHGASILRWLGSETYWALAARGRP